MSQPEELTHGTFQPVLGDAEAEQNPAAVERVILASGRIVYDLLAERKKVEPDKISTAILRVEQLYPLAADEIVAELAKYSNATEIRWVQVAGENFSSGDTPVPPAPRTAAATPR